MDGRKRGKERERGETAPLEEEKMVVVAGDFRGEKSMCGEQEIGTSSWCVVEYKEEGDWRGRNSSRSSSSGRGSCKSRKSQWESRERNREEKREFAGHVVSPYHGKRRTG